MKDEATVIREFNQLVNMTSDEMEAWLKTDESINSGWPKDDGSGETIGHESGRHILDVLKKNPNMDPSQYDASDIVFMRRVVSYCKRHLAQEQTAKMNPSSKSHRSLKNWGHDPLKT